MTANFLAIKVGDQSVLVPISSPKASSYVNSLIPDCENAGALPPCCSSADGLQLPAHILILGRAHHSVLPAFSSSSAALSHEWRIWCSTTTWAAILPHHNVKKSVATKKPISALETEVVKRISNESRFCQSKTGIRLSLQVRDLKRRVHTCRCLYVQDTFCQVRA